MLKQIIEQKPNSDIPLEQEFFGAHNQAVDELGNGFVKTAVGSDRKLIEAAESEHGAPVITIQFHPEVTVHGLPNSSFLYKKSKPEIETSLKIFDFFAKAGETYRNKKNLMNEIKEKVKKIEIPLVKGEKKEEKIKIKVVPKKENIKKEVKKEKKAESILKKLTNYMSKVIDKISKYFDKVKSFFRTIISNKLTSVRVGKLKKQEQLIGVEGSKKKNGAKISQRKKNDSTGKIIKIQMESSHQLPKMEESSKDFDVSVEKENRSPVEIMVNETAKAWPENKQRVPGEEVLDEKEPISHNSLH
jgi:hypothetical protein